MQKTQFEQIRSIRQARLAERFGRVARTAALLSLVTLPIAAAGSVNAGQESAPPAAILDPTVLLQRQLKELLTKTVGPAENWEVKFLAPASTRAAGVNLEIHGSGIRTEAGLLVSQARVELRGVTFNPADGTIERLDTCRFEASLKAADLEAYLARRESAALPGLHLALQDGMARVNCPVKAGFLGVRAEVVARPVLRDGRVELEARSLRVVGIPIPEKLLRKIERQANPLVDARQLAVPMTIETLAIERDGLRIAGALRVDDTLQPPAAPPSAVAFTERRQQRGHRTTER